ncbi:hypothetical protein ACLOJK_021055 [Asimina triloba]
MEREREEVWNKTTVPLVLQLVSSRLPQRDVISLLLLSPWCYRALLSHLPLWQALDLREMTNAGERLIAALSLDWVSQSCEFCFGFALKFDFHSFLVLQPRYRNIENINLEFAQDVEDKYLIMPKSECMESLQGLQTLNLNGCQKISDNGIEAITIASPKLKRFSIYWNNCKDIRDLNLSGCKNISDKGLRLIADNYQELEQLNLTSLTDETYKNITFLPNLEFLDLCGAQHLSDEGLSCIAKCVRVTDVGVIAVAEGCPNLEFLSLFGIVGVTDQCLEALSQFCSDTLMTLDVNGCIGIKGNNLVMECLETSDMRVFLSSIVLDTL